MACTPHAREYVNVQLTILVNEKKYINQKVNLVSPLAIAKLSFHRLNTLHTSLALDVNSVNRERNGCHQGVSVSEYESL